MIKNKINEVKFVMNLGKNGLTDSVLEEIKKQLKIHKIIKIKLLKTFLFEGDVSNLISNKIKCKIIEKKGRTIVFSVD